MFVMFVYDLSLSLCHCLSVSLSLCLSLSLTHTHIHDVSCGYVNVCGHSESVLSGHLPRLLSTPFKQYFLTIFICLFGVRVHVNIHGIVCVWTCLPMCTGTKGYLVSCSVLLSTLFSLWTWIQQATMVFHPNPCTRRKRVHCLSVSWLHWCHYSTSWLHWNHHHPAWMHWCHPSTAWMHWCHDHIAHCL